MARTFYGPEFLKVFVPEHSSKHLRIPPAFVKNFVQELEKRAILKDNNGRYWCVDMVIIGDHLCFGTGWEDFVREHCLVNGDSFLFKRLGKSMFGVKIYDQNGCRKKIEAIPKIIEGIEVNEEERSTHKGPWHAYKATPDERRGLNGSTEKSKTTRIKPSGFDRDLTDRITKLKAAKYGKEKDSSIVGAWSPTVPEETPTATKRKQIHLMSREEMLVRVARKKLTTLTSRWNSTVEEIPLNKHAQATTIDRASLFPSPISQSSDMSLKKKTPLEDGRVDVELSGMLSLQEDFNAAFQVGSSLLTPADEEILLSKPIRAVAERFAAHSAWAIQEGLALGCFYVRLQALYKTLEQERDSLQTQLEEKKSDSEKKERELMTLLGEANRLHRLELEKNEHLMMEVTELREEAKDNYSLGWMKARCELLREHMEGKQASWDASAAEVAHYEALLVETEEVNDDSHQEGP